MTAPKPPRLPVPPTIAAAFFVTGAAGLIDELAWSRMLANLFGSSLLAASVVFGLFMAGLALGNAAGGRIADRMARPALLYAACELVLGFYTLATPALYRLLERWFLALPLTGGSATEVVAELAIAAVILLPPVMLMGASLPALTAAIGRPGMGVGSATAWLYAINTAGAVAGVVAAGFFLLPAFGVTGTLGVAAILDVAAAAAVALRARVVRRREERLGRVATVIPGRFESDPTPPRLSPGRAAAAAALAGFAALAAEIAWARALGLVVGSSVYSLASLLGAYLAGLAIGSLWEARMRRNRPEPDDVAGIAGRVAFAIAVFAAIYVAVPQGYIFILQHFPSSFPALMAAQFGLLALAIVYPTALMGALLPALVGASSRADEPGRSTARVFAWNTLGAVLGSLAAGFFLVPRLGMRGTLVAASALELAAAWICVRAGEPGSARRVWLPLAAGTLVVWIAFPFWLTRWNPAVVNGGYYAYAYLYAGAARAPIDPPAPERLRSHFSVLASASQLDVWRRERAAKLAAQAESWTAPAGAESAEQFVHVEEGRLATVAVVESGGVRSLLINGKADASNGWAGDMRTQLLLGHLPALAHAGGARRALVIGLGSGVTAGALASHPEVERIDVVEIEPAVVTASRYFDDVSGAPLRDPRVRLHVEDARRFVFRHGEPYDVITSEPSNLWMSGVASLFTDEFFRAAADRLAPQGIFCQWIHLYQIAPKDIAVFLATFRRSFPHYELFLDDRDLLVLGSRTPIALGPDVETRLAARPAALRDLTLAGFEAVSDIETLRIPRPPGAAALAGQPINRDDYPILEFSAARSATSDLSVPITAWLRGEERGK